MTPHPPPGERRRPGPAPSLSIDDITTSAIEIADNHGLDAVTMRSVAGALGVSGPALYRYVDSREELLGHMVDQASGEITHPAPTGDVVRDLVGVAGSQRAVFTTHPWLATAIASPLIMGPNMLAHLEWCLAALEPVDVPATRKMEAIALVTGAATLFARGGAKPRPDAFTHLDPALHPHLSGVFAASPPSGGSVDLFPRVVTAILHGVLRTTTTPG